MVTTRSRRPHGRGAVALAAAVTVLVVAATVVTVQAVGGGDGDAWTSRLTAASTPDHRDSGPPPAAEPVPRVTVPELAAPPAPATVMTPVPPPAAPSQAAEAAAVGTGPRGQGRSPQPPSTPRAPAACEVGAAAGNSQVVVVRSSGTTATVRACTRSADGSYLTDLGPYTGFVGRSGVTPAGSKREGDGATPGGVFALRGGFGTRADPGLAQGWFTVDGADVWVDDPDSRFYNTHQREPAEGRWASAEKLADPPAYTYAQVIGHNEGARPGAGSAIFLHVSTGNPTLGCVSLPSSALLEVMRWQRSGAVIAIS